MQIIEVQSPAHIKAFLELPFRIYQNYPQWVAPLLHEVEAVFDPQQNEEWNEGTCQRWILQDAQGQCIGRVAAFVGVHTRANSHEQPTGGMGFFECIENQEAAFLLFDTCKAYLEAQGCEAMDGPINFGGRDKFWGLLVSGHDKAPNYQMTYQPPYYQAFFEDFGFQIYFRQYTYGRLLGKASERVHKRAERILSNPSYTFKQVDKKHLEKFADDFRLIYNNSFALSEGLGEMSQEESYRIMREMRPIIDPRLITFAYYGDTPVGFGIFIPELNQVFRYVRGKMNWWGKLKFAYYLYVKKVCKKVAGIAFGVSARFHGRGLEAALSVCLEKKVYTKDFPYKDIELNWVGDFNPPMMRLAEELDFSIVKEHITYRKLFDPAKPFSRHPVRSYRGKA